jgi:hypothetical protein
VTRVGPTLKAGSGDKNATDLPKLSRPAQRALASVGIRRLKDLARFSEAQVKNLHGIGPNVLAQLRTALAAAGLSYSDKH